MPACYTYDVRAWSAGVVLLSLYAGCTPPRPPRYVIESDLAGYHYRRYQKVLDVELPVPENPAVGHTATYVRDGRPPQVVPVMVTRYQRPRGLTESVRAQLRTLSSYTLDVEKLAREHVWRLRGETGDVWLLWISGSHLVKIGAPEGASMVPSAVAEAYLDRYPSDLDRRGNVSGGAASAGPATDPRTSQAPRLQPEPRR